MTPPDLLHEASPTEIRRLREAIQQFRAVIDLMEAQLAETRQLLASKEQKLTLLTGRPVPAHRPTRKPK